MMSKYNKRLYITSLFEGYSCLTNEEWYGISYGTNLEKSTIKEHLEMLLNAHYIVSFSEVSVDKQNNEIIETTTWKKYHFDSSEGILFPEQVPQFIFHTNKYDVKVKFVWDMNNRFKWKPSALVLEALRLEELNHYTEVYHKNNNVIDILKETHSNYFPLGRSDEYIYDFLFFLKHSFLDDYNKYIVWVDRYLMSIQDVKTVYLDDIEIICDTIKQSITFIKAKKMVGYIDISKSDLWKIIHYCVKNNLQWPLKISHLFKCIWKTKSPLDAMQAFNDMRYRFSHNSTTDISKLDINKLIYKWDDDSIYLNYRTYDE